MTNVYRAAIVGLGNIAWRFDSPGVDHAVLSHAGSYCSSGRTQLVGGFSPDSTDRADFADRFGIPVFDSLETLMDATAPDIVSICSPADHHYDQAIACIDRGIPMIWLEKPPARTAGQMSALIERTDRPEPACTVLVNFQRRYAAPYNRLREIYTGESLGPCRMIQINYSRGLANNGSHMLDILFFITGDRPPGRIVATESITESVNPSFSMLLDDGTPVVVSGIDVPYHCIDISLVCDRGRASVLHGGATQVIEKRKENEWFKGFHRLDAETKNVHYVPWVNGCMEAALADLIRAHERGIPPCSSLKTSYLSQLVMDRLLQAAGESRP